MDGGQWTVDGGRWTVDGGQWTRDRLANQEKHSASGLFVENAEDKGVSLKMGGVGLDWQQHFALGSQVSAGELARVELAASTVE